MNRKHLALFASLVIAAAIPHAPAAAPRIVTGPDTQSSQPQINVFRPDAQLAKAFMGADSSFTGGVRVAVGDITGVSDIVAGAGPGGGPRVTVFSGPSRTPVYSFFAFEPGFNGGVYVAAGDVNGDGRADIIVGRGEEAATGPGGGPRVIVIDGRNVSVKLAEFFAFDTAFKGGVRVASGDVNGDGTADIVVGAGPGGNRVRVFSGKDLTVLHDLVPNPAGGAGGVFVGASDVDGDGRADIVVGENSGSSAVRVFSGATGMMLRTFIAFEGSTGGARVSGTDLNRDGVGDILVSSGPGGATRVKVFDGRTGQVLADFLPYGSSYTNGAFVGAVPRFPPVLLNIATRINVRSGDNALIGGFIVNGTEPKRIMIRGIGPSTGVPGALQDPTLELNDASAVLATNDNWKETQMREIEASSIPPKNDAESAIVRTLAPGAYTAILRGKNDTTGIGLIEVYDLDQSADAKPANISSRGLVDTGDNVLIGGFIVGGGGGTGRARCAVRAIGPSLAAQGLPALQNPTLQLVDASGAIIGENDNWKETQQAEAETIGLQPADDAESILIALLVPGAYTAIVRGKDDASGVGLVEIYNVNN